MRAGVAYHRTESQLRSGFGAGSVLVAAGGVVVELSLLAAGAGVLLSDDVGAGACVDVSGAAAGLGVIVLFC